MPKITIERPYEWYNQRKRIDVYIDNIKMGHVGIDETIYFEVASGKHTLMLKNQWPGRNTSIKVDLSNNKDKTVKMTSCKWIPWINFVSIVLTITILSIIRSYFDTVSFWAIQFPVIVVMLAVVGFVTSRMELLKLEIIDKR